MTKRQYCSGCDNNFYNGNNNIGVAECWSLKGARVVTRYCIGWWTPMDTAKNFSQCKTLNCHTESGRAAFLDQIPPHLATEWHELQRKQREAKPPVPHRLAESAPDDEIPF